LENVQHRATKLVPSLSKYSYEERLRRMDLPSLSYRRRSDLIETFKYLHGIYRSDSFSWQLMHNGTTRGHSLKLKFEDMYKAKAKAIGFSRPRPVVFKAKASGFRGLARPRPVTTKIQAQGKNSFSSISKSFQCQNHSQ